MCSVDPCGDVGRREGYPCGLGHQRGGLEPATPSEVLLESRTSSWPAAFEGSHGAATAWVERAVVARVSNCRSRRSISRHGRGGARALACARPSRGSRSCPVAFPLAHGAALGRAPAAATATAPTRTRGAAAARGPRRLAVRVARAAYSLVSRAWACRWRAATTRARRGERRLNASRINRAGRTRLNAFRICSRCKGSNVTLSVIMSKRPPSQSSFIGADSVMCFLMRSSSITNPDFQEAQETRRRCLGWPCDP